MIGNGITIRKRLVHIYVYGNTVHELKYMKNLQSAESPILIRVLSSDKLGQTRKHFPFHQQTGVKSMGTAFKIYFRLTARL